jgi:rhodanese-related sulfurtransferase
MTDIPELTPTQFCERWPLENRQKVTLLDVREATELEIASLQDTKHIPMMQIPVRLHELSRDNPLVVICHSGGRSRRVSEFLLSSGFSSVFNLTGGIDAWSQEIDASIPRY